MGEELGRIEKPTVESFGAGRKLFLVPLIFRSPDAPADYSEKFDLYWQQVKEQIANLESKIGKVSRVYHESIAVAGDDALKVIEKLNVGSYQIIKEKYDKEAQIEATEDRELVDEGFDWERLLFVGFVTEKVARIVSEHYVGTFGKRQEYIGKRIDETLQPGEISILFIREGHRVQFPTDIQVFSVSPPALDQIHRWLRDRSAEEAKSQEHHT